MSLFLLTFFLVYGCMNLYFFLKLNSVFVLNSTAGFYIAFFLCLMILAPPVVRLLEKGGYYNLAGAAAYTGYFWMAVIFIFLLSSLCVDLYKLLLYLATHFFNKDVSYLRVPALQSFLLPLLIAVGISVYGYFEALNIRTEKVTIKTRMIPASAGKIKIAQISDVHLGLIVREERLKRILNAVKLTEPDILISTGDLVDGTIIDYDNFAKIFNEINPRYGKFAVTGNHEFYAGIEKALEFTKKAGFTVLRDETAEIAGLITVAGVDDTTVMSQKTNQQGTEIKLLTRPRSNNFMLFLKHRPLVDKSAIPFFDLQLSGHTHRGQIFPFYFITKLFFPLNGGLHVLNGEGANANSSRLTYLYVSRGSGTWGPPVRFLSPPEITVIELSGSGK